MIPEAAVEAAYRAMYGTRPNPSIARDAHLLAELTKALVAAAPHMLKTHDNEGEK